MEHEKLMCNVCTQPSSSMLSPLHCTAPNEWTTSMLPKRILPKPCYSYMASTWVCAQYASNMQNLCRIRCMPVFYHLRWLFHRKPQRINILGSMPRNHGWQCNVCCLLIHQKQVEQAPHFMRPVHPALLLVMPSTSVQYVASTRSKPARPTRANGAQRRSQQAVHGPTPNFGVSGRFLDLKVAAASTCAALSVAKTYVLFEAHCGPQRP